MERRQSEVGSAFEKMCETHILSFSRLVYLYLPVTVPSRLPKAPEGQGLDRLYLIFKT